MSTTTGTGGGYIAPDRTISTGPINLTGATAGGCRYALAAAAQETANETAPALPFQIDLTPFISGKVIVPGSVCFSWGGNRYVDRLGIIYRNPDPLTGMGVEAGFIDYTSGLVTLTSYDSGSNTVVVHSLLARYGHQFIAQAVFRTPGSPVRPQSFQILGLCADGRQITGDADFSGQVTGTLCKGRIDNDQGIVYLYFGEMVDSIGQESEPWYKVEDIEGGMIWKPMMAFADQFQYTCVIYSYLPLNADLIGIDPVRLPSDGRVPIAQIGDYVLVHNTQVTTLSNPVTAGQEITLPREGIKLVELYDQTEPLALRVPSTKYTWDKDAQLLTMADPLDLTGFVQPLVAMHRVEDMRMIAAVQVNGQVVLNYGVTADYPVEGTYVSTVLPFGDLQARYYSMFDQKTWTSVFSDNRIGDATSAGYNEINYPMLVTNSGSVKGRWALVFTDASHFNIVEEVLGIIGSGYTTQDCAPLNPATGKPYWFLDYRGWGIGWATGNVLRFNTDGANPDFWIARTILPGLMTEPNDQFVIHFKGNAE